MLNHVDSCEQESDSAPFEKDIFQSQNRVIHGYRTSELSDYFGSKVNNGPCNGDRDGGYEDIYARLKPWKTVRAQADFKGSCETELSFQRDEWLSVLNDTDAHWWWCSLNGVEGYAPTNHLALNMESDSEEEQICWQDEVYFGRYSEIQFHLEMLLDKERTNTYMHAIQNNKDALKGNVVLDVGCGSGILSMLCARDGTAGHVYAVDASSIVNLAARAIKQNGLEDQITVVYGKVEEITLPGHSKVDLIISEWMGTLLISECMIESVIIARDTFLKEGGKMWPSSASLYLAPCTAESTYEQVSLRNWDEMYNFNFSAFKVEASQELLDKPLHKHLASLDDILAEPHVVLSMSLETVTLADIEKSESYFSFVIRKCSTFHGFCTWFTVDFDPLLDYDSKEKVVVLDTGPGHQKTHWRHPLLPLDYPLQVKEGMIVKGKVILSRHPVLRRHVHLNLVGDIISHENSAEIVVASFSKQFKCWQ